MKAVFAILIALLGCGFLSAQVAQDSVKIYFHQGKHTIQPTFKSNQQMLDKIDRSVLKLEKVEVVGSASPEGSVRLNERLSQKRAQVLFDYLSRYGNLPDSLKTTRFIGRDWRGLLRLVEADPKVPYQKESARLISEIIREVEKGIDTRKIDPFWRLVSFRGGKPYRYMYYNLFPELRTSEIHLWFEPAPRALQALPTCLSTTHPEFFPIDWPVIPMEEAPSYRWAIKTNALYDLLLVPNVGVEFCLGDHWSVGANWMYAWWKHDAKHWYWRVYGGDLYARRWFGKQAKEKALTGHHLGVYAQLLTYDFALGGRGYMGGAPGGNLLDKANFAGGIEYGYSLPIASRLNLDFSIGVGYMNGVYHEYIPEDDCYVWQATKERHWFGPTKAEVSLVWLWGRDHKKTKKGGSR